MNKLCACGRPISAGWTNIGRRGSRTTCLLCETARTFEGWAYAPPVVEPRQPSVFDRRTYHRKYMRAWRARNAEQKRSRKARIKAQTWQEMINRTS